MPAAMAPVSRHKTGPRPAITVYRIYMVLYGTYFYKPTASVSPDLST